jgi:hypothetical protein
MATISNTPRPGYVWDATDNVWYPIGVGAHQHTNAADTPAVMPYSTYAAAGKNKIINGDFRINQRGFTSTTTDSAFGFDRWFSPTNGGSTYSAQTFTPGTAPVTGYNGVNFARLVTTGQTGLTAYSILTQKIEDIRTIADQTVTISFWAKAATGTPKIAVEFFNYFGSGGSPSTSTQTYAGQTTLSTSWARYAVTVTLPSLSGKTLGTNNDSSLNLQLWVSAGTDFNSRTGSLGIQSNTFDIWGVQVEAGSNVTAFQTATGNPASELAACQRYFNRLVDGTIQAVGTLQAISTTAALGTRSFPEMRIGPTVTYTSIGDFSLRGATNTVLAATGSSSFNIGRQAVSIYFTVASGLVAGNASEAFSTGANARLDLSAEL